MRQSIKTAPKDGRFLIVDDDVTGRYDIACWSAERGLWIGEDGTPSTVNPTHWRSLPHTRDEARAWKAEGLAPVPRRRRRFGASAIIAGLMLISFSATYFGAEIGAFVEAPDLLATARLTSERAAAAAQQAGDKIDVLTRELAAARREIETQRALSTRVAADAAQVKRAADSTTADFQRALQQERERAEALVRELAAVRSQSDAQIALTTRTANEAAQARQAAERTVTDLRQGLQQERDRAETLARELLSARDDAKKYTALAAQAADDTAQARQAADSATADFQRAMQHARDRADALQRELAMARSESTAALGAQDAQARQAAERAAAESRQALQVERDKAEALARALAAARDEIKTQVSLAAAASDEAAQARQAAEQAVVALRQALEQERARATALARDLESTRHADDQRREHPPGNLITQGMQAAAEYRLLAALERERSRVLERRTTPAVAASAVRGPPASAPDGPAVAAATSPPAVAAKPPLTGGPDAERLVVRASQLLAQGDIGAARIVLEYAADMGSAQASFALAETYDPLVLAAWRTLGTRGDVMKARELYAKAHAGGIQEAQDRLSALRQ